MSLIKHLIFKFVTWIFVNIPFNNYLAILLRKFNLGKHKIYKDLKFKGKFKVPFLFQKNNLEFKMYHFGSYIENETFWKGLFKSFERESGAIWMEFSKVSTYIFDIGANTGIYSLVSKTINPKSKIYAFEPSLNTKEKLKKNILLNKFEILQFDVALGENDGIQIFYDYKSKNQTSASLSPEKSKDVNNLWKYEVKTFKLDTFIQNEKIHQIDLLKMDVEMYEPQVLNGFKNNISSLLPVIFIEVLTEDVGKEIFSLIVNDYFIYQLKPDSSIQKVNNFTIVAFVWNYLLIPKKKFSIYEPILKKFEK